jgi:hypothetical protein
MFRPSIPERSQPMKTTINATRVIPRRIMCLALSLVAMAALALRSQAAQADKQVPFNAAFTTVFVSDGNFPIARITVIGQGQATPLGTATAATTNQLVNLNTGESTATYTFAAANGDTFVLEEKFLSTFDPTSGRVTFDGTYVVTGGTGRFAGATGSGTLSGSAVFTGPNNGIGSFTLLGTISSPGSLK